MVPVLRRLAFSLLALGLSLALVGCPRGTRKTLVPDVPQSGDAEARSRFAEARAKFLRDGTSGAEFHAIVEDFPDDPIVPWAELYAGIAAVKERKFAVAIKALASAIDADANPGLTQRAELFLGIARNYAGEGAVALRHLKRGEKAIESEDERTEWIAATAYATATGERPLASLVWFDQLVPRVTPTERALLVARVAEVVADAEPATLERMYDQLDDRHGPSITLIASRLALLAEAAGRTADAARLREVAAPGRLAFGLPRTLGA